MDAYLTGTGRAPAGFMNYLFLDGAAKVFAADLRRIEKLADRYPDPSSRSA